MFTVTMPTDASVLPLLPSALVAATAIVVILADIFLLDAQRKHWTAWIALVGLAFAGLVTLAIYGGLGHASIPSFGGFLILDDFALFVDILVIVVTIVAVLMSAEYLVEQGIEHAEFYVLMLFAASAMMLMGTSAELITLWVCLETFSIALYVLAAYARPKVESEEAGLKYFFLGAFAGAFLLYGIALLYAGAGTTTLAGIGRFVQANGTAALGNALLLLGLGLVLVGLSFKAAFVPFHQWTPDVYEGAPTAVTAFMATATKAAAFAALLRILLVAFPGPLAPTWTVALAIIAALTMLGGNLMALAQNNIKRMLAYSSIAQAGYVLVAVVAGASNAAMFYLLAYAMMTLGAFAVIISLNNYGSEMLDIDSYAGLAGRAPGRALALALFMFALTGFPPLAGFVGKWFIFSSAVATGWTWLALIGALASVISAGYYLRIVVLMYMRPAPAETQPLGSPTGGAAWAMGITVVAVLLLGVFASPILNMAQSTLLALR
ncbi:MAG: NADH-quinone oxidoreductase subunit N [Anaerolineae bacterium]